LDLTIKHFQFFTDGARCRSRLVTLVNISPADCSASGVDALDGFRFIIVGEGRRRTAKATPTGRRSTLDDRLILAGEDGSTDIGRESLLSHNNHSFCDGAAQVALSLCEINQIHN